MGSVSSWDPRAAGRFPPRLAQSLGAAKLALVPTKVSPSAQDYLKALYLETENEHRLIGEAVSTNAIAQRLSLSAPSATNMLKKLHEMGLVTHVPYQGSALTEAGQRVALELVRHHRLLEAYLVDALGVPWDEVHKEAEILEHVLSEELEERIDAGLGHPTSDPHGQPIPTREGAMPARTERRLSDLEERESSTVAWVSDNLPEVLRYLAVIGIRPGVELRIVGRTPVNGPLAVLVDGRESHSVPQGVAETVWVS
ncbi:MAG: metal-dependent transcriptional regulator [Actinobacteria bacterium]|nr:metal-dependent transcriptional regulator [Actinomycetota bacterium]